MRRRPRKPLNPTTTGGCLDAVDPAHRTGRCPEVVYEQHMGTQVIDQEEEWNDYTT